MLTQNAEVERDASTPELVGASPALRTAVGLSPQAAVAKSGPPNLAAEEAARSPLSPAAAFYVDGLGWPIILDADEIILRCGEGVDVLAMPIGLAGEVNHLLSLHRIAAPIVEVRSQGRTAWAFFCETGRLSTKGHTLGLLSLHHIVHFGIGKNVSLPPSSAAKGATLRWVVEPRLDTPIPHWASLVSCVLTVIKR